MAEPKNQEATDSLVHDADEVSTGWSGKSWAKLIVSGKGRPVALVMLAILVAIILLFGDALEPWRNISFDSHHIAAPRTAEVLPIRIVEIDEKSLQEYGQWPWPRHLLADLIQGVSFRGAIVIGLDLIFPEPDRMSPHLMAESLDEVDNDVRDALRAVPSNDEVFSRVLGRLPVVLGRAALNGVAAEAWVDRDPPFPPTVLQHPSLIDALPEAGAVLTNLPSLEQNAIGFGVLNGPPDADGVVRKVPTALNIGGKPHASMTLEVLRVALGSPQALFVGTDGVIEGIDINGNFFPTDSNGMLRPHFTHSLDDRFLSAADVLSGSVDANAFENQIVLIGVTGIGVIDKRATPVSARVHGVEIQAQVLENLLHGTRLVRPDWTVIAETCTLVFLGGLIVFLMPIRPVWATSAIFLAGIIASIVGSHYAFAAEHVLLDPLLPSFMATIIFLTMLGALLTEMDRRRRALRSALQKERVSAAKIAGELQAARDIQLGILPKLDALSGVPDSIQINAFLESAKEVGGDLYDAFVLEDGRLFFLVGDVTGKGVPASLFMALSKVMSKGAALRGGGSGTEWGMDAVMELANDEISRENPADLFVTMFAGVVDGATGKIEFCNAGHENPHIISSDGSVRELECDGGPPLCVFEGFPYPREEVTLGPGEVLVITTDGVTEARNYDGGFYGHDRLITALKKVAAESDLDTGLDHLVQDVRRFEDGIDPTDDLTLMALRFTG